MPGAAYGAPSSDDTLAQTAVESGDFATAKRAFTHAAGKSGDLEALTGLAQIALYENRLPDARRALRGVLTRQPANEQAQRMLRSVDQRAGAPNDFLVRRYPGRDVVLETIAPIPLVRVRVNGDREGLFAIDTTAASVLLDETFAQSLHYTPDLPARLSDVHIGNGEIDNVPARIVPLARTALGHDVHIDGVLGLAFLSRFLLTLDYPRKRLGLEPPRTRSNAATAHATAVWFGDERHLFTEARLNRAPPALFSIDTGVPVAILVSAQTYAAAHLWINRSRMVQLGASGTLRFIPFSATLIFGDRTLGGLEGSLLAAGTPTGNFPFPVGGTVGNAAFANLILTLDFANMGLTVTRRR